MSEPMLIFETDPQLGTPKLRAINGSANNWSQKDLCHLEEQLRPRYESLVREGEGTISFKGRTLHVKKKDGDTSRQPTLELRSAESSTTEKISACPKPQAVDWGKGFLAEIDRLFASDIFKKVLPVERAMLHLVREELQGLLEKKPGAESVLFVLVSILVTAEQLSRTQRPNEPHPYAFALSGIERVLSETGVKPQMPWGNLPDKPNSDPMPSWLGRFWSRLKRT